VQQALTELRRVFGPEAVFHTSLLTLTTTDDGCRGKIEARVYLL
jgi:hypothetical protein